ncbi:hypothetical protein MBLNU13_g11086t1 [Cladosporium sp. NU13]
MKFFLVSFLVAILMALAMAADADQQPIIVSFPEGTPYSEMDELKAAIAKVGGVITHEYNLFMGLACKVPANFISTIKTMGEDHNVAVEYDQTVSINDQDHSA